MDEFIIARAYRSIVSPGCNYFTQDRTSLFQPDYIRLAVQPRVVVDRPAGRDEFFAFADFAGLFSRSAAGAAIHFRASSTYFARACGDSEAILKNNRFTDVSLAETMPTVAILVGDLKPQLVWTVTSDFHMNPIAACQSKAGSRALGFTRTATACLASYRPCPVALKASFLLFRGHCDSLSGRW